MPLLFAQALEGPTCPAMHLICLFLEPHLLPSPAGDHPPPTEALRVVLAPSSTVRRLVLGARLPHQTYEALAKALAQNTGLHELSLAGSAMGDDVLKASGPHSHSFFLTAWSVNFKISAGGLCGKYSYNQ